MRRQLQKKLIFEEEAQVSHAEVAMGSPSAICTTRVEGTALFLTILQSVQDQTFPGGRFPYQKRFRNRCSSLSTS